MGGPRLSTGRWGSGRGRSHGLSCSRGVPFCAPSSGTLAGPPSAQLGNLGSGRGFTKGARRTRCRRAGPGSHGGEAVFAGQWNRRQLAARSYFLGGKCCACGESGRGHRDEYRRGGCVQPGLETGPGPPGGLPGYSPRKLRDRAPHGGGGDRGFGSGRGDPGTPGRSLAASGLGG